MHPAATFGHPGPQRDYLNSLILQSQKTATSSLLAHYGELSLPASGELALPASGAVHELLDSYEQPIATIRITDVTVCALRDVPLEHCRAEGEGFGSVAHWRQVHETFWLEDGTPPDILNDDAMVVLERFELHGTYSPQPWKVDYDWLWSPQARKHSAVLEARVYHPDGRALAQHVDAFLATLHADSRGVLGRGGYVVRPQAEEYSANCRVLHLVAAGEDIADAMQYATEDLLEALEPLAATRVQWQKLKP